MFINPQTLKFQNFETMKPWNSETCTLFLPPAP